MISRRLTKAQKEEILEAYRSGENTNTLSERYNCSPNTINRTVKTLLSENEYKLLKQKRSKFATKKEELFSHKDDLLSLEDSLNHNSESNNEDFVIRNDSSISESEIELSSGSVENNSFEDSNINESSSEFDDSFEEIAPLFSAFDFVAEKQKLEFELLNHENLPDSVYMLVDKKVELESKLISELPEWNFLPESELKRNAILLFSNQRSAKRNCSRTQRVIKIPNTRVFGISKSYLVSKGITRLILDDSIIALDN